MPQDVFISYSSKDKMIADAACAKLEMEGIRCWIAPRDIQPGNDWSGAIVRAIDSSRIMILIFSAHANESPQIMRELNRAVSKSVKIIPFRIEDVPMSESIEYYIGIPHWLDALTPPLEKHLDYLTETVRLLVSRNDPDGLPSSIIKLTQQAEDGDINAMINLGLAYAQGIDVKRNYQKSTPLFRKAAELGNPRGMNNYGYALQQGHGVEPDPVGAVYWFSKAADQKDEIAICNLGCAYRDGLGVDQNVQKAISIFELGVENNNPDAMASLGVLYLRDEVGIDIERARDLFQRGACLGNAWCMYNIGTLYDNGQGYERDEIEAVNWYRRAASKGNSQAKERLKILGYEK